MQVHKNQPKAVCVGYLFPLSDRLDIFELVEENLGIRVPSFLGDPQQKLITDSLVLLDLLSIIVVKLMPKKRQSKSDRSENQQNQVLPQ
jgi:hypothetical protein